MKRDMELIRLLLIESETGESPDGLSGYPLKERLYNLQLMSDAGLVVARFVPDVGEPSSAYIDRLTWSGHDFLDATRDSKIWKKAKEHFIRAGVSWTFETLLEFLKREIDQRVFGSGSPSP